ncbi:MAG: sulfurtransferase TusA family protein [Thermoanaerobacterales bacterium]|nr:sulfurtransferase TusA family protein [Bacillota bacterium]MDI6906055.1 sulfurtransferase TusA family protein [Thermoanaerobacterales bacterium]
MNKPLVDTRGLVCPEPMLMVKRVLDGMNSGVMEVLADTAAARENIKRLAQSRGWRVEIGQQGEDILLTLSRD